MKLWNDEMVKVVNERVKEVFDDVDIEVERLSDRWKITVKVDENQAVMYITTGNLYKLIEILSRRCKDDTARAGAKVS